MANILETKDLTVTFGGLNACDKIDLTVPDGKFVGLIGPNGAGKTTFIDAITGYVPTSSGDVKFSDENINDLKPFERTRKGLVRTFQSLELFEDLSVRDNLSVAAYPSKWNSFITDLFRLSKKDRF